MNLFWRKKELIFGLLFLGLFLVVYWLKGVANIPLQMVGFDEGYNATVAANFSSSGVYRVSYPEAITFYDMITTGVTVLVPTAWIYSRFGISAFTTNIISLIYSMAASFSMWILFSRVLKRSRLRHVLAALMVWLLVLTDRYYYYNSTHLIGEIAALLFAVLFLLGLFSGLADSSERIHMFLAGIMLSAALLTKSSMIFFVTSAVLLLFVETFFCKTVHPAQLLLLLFGFLTGFAALDSLKWIQLGGWEAYWSWWADEFQNMLTQSSGISTQYTIWEKLLFLSTDAFQTNVVMSLVLLLLPVILYGYHVYQSVRWKRRQIGGRILGTLIFGTSGASLLIFFVLLGGEGLRNGRRLSVNSMIIKIAAVCLLIWILYRLFRERKRMAVFAVAAGLLLSTPTAEIENNANTLLEPAAVKTYEQLCMEQFIEYVDLLPEDAKIYCEGWWQEPNIALFTDREMIDISMVDVTTIPKKHAYFIIGRRFDGCTVDMVQVQTGLRLVKTYDVSPDYHLLESWGSKELFSVYQIVEW